MYHAPQLAGLLSYWAFHCGSGALAVGLGAFGAHGLRNKVDARMLEVWDTGVRYHFVHSLLGLFAVLHREVAAARAKGSAYPNVASTGGTNYGAALALVGNIFFAGSLYGIVLTDVKKLGVLTPIGGLIYIAAWLCVGLGM